MKKISKTEDMYNMHFNTWYEISSNTFVMRVPGGWLYSSGESTVFVPFNSEEMK